MTNFSVEDTMIILGDSPFIEQIEDRVQYVLSKYYSIGINTVLSKFKTTYHAFIHFSLIPYSKDNPEIKIICPYYLSDRVRKTNVEYYNIFKLDIPKETEVYKENALAWGGYTHDYAISYCIHKGFKNVILIGAADFIEGKHYSRPDKFIFSNKTKNDSKRFIKFCSSKINLYTCNPESELEINKIDINTLLS